MNLIDFTTDDVLVRYAPLVKKQLLSLKIYKDYDEYYQIGLIALWEAQSKFNPDKGTFATYAIATVRGRLLTLLRKERDFAQKHCLTDEDYIHVQDERVNIPFELEMLKPYLEAMTKREQNWVMEAIVNQKKTSEIASEYAVTMNTVRSWRKGVVKKVKNMPER
ncbi:sigma-70 family RNA polymerase sigma factor [Bacillus solitudinis]|uniref:sigma-70 family RNA polymerase sigma factor n=1 Tax=Bacillus solitudinis TaxID=2014074 RepID=UPI000C23C621|nr:sigma-70 family RNA polymerase sigma factor [Bacillus solitudinis]